MIQVSQLHLELARALSDNLTEFGEEFTTGFEDGLRFKYEDRKNAIENAIGQVIEYIYKNDPYSLGFFYASSTFTNPTYNNYTSGVYEYVFITSTRFMKIVNAIIKSTTVPVRKDLYVMPYITNPQGWLIGSGILNLINDVNTLKLRALLPNIMHTSSPNEVSLDVVYLTPEGKGGADVILPIDNAYYQMIFSIAFQNLIQLKR